MAILRKSSSYSSFRHITSCFVIISTCQVFSVCLLFPVARLKNYLTSRAVVSFLPPRRCLFSTCMFPLSHTLLKNSALSTINVGQMLNSISWIAVIWQGYDDFFLFSGQFFSVRSHRFYEHHTFVYQRGITKK